MENIQKLDILKGLCTLRECLIDYVGPIYYIGDIELVQDESATIVSATMPKSHFAIINNKLPDWVEKVNQKRNNPSNVLIIKDIDRISVSKQELLIDILENNKISSINLPNNLKIILNSNEKCKISDKIRPFIECYEIRN